MGWRLVGHGAFPFAHLLWAEVATGSTILSRIDRATGQSSLRRGPDSAGEMVSGVNLKARVSRRQFLKFAKKMPDIFGLLTFFELRSSK
jgi:hypothetical protein